jgi:hypothetical protein
MKIRRKKTVNGFRRTTFSAIYVNFVPDDGAFCHCCLRREEEGRKENEREGEKSGQVTLKEEIGLISQSARDRKCFVPANKKYDNRLCKH